MIRLLFVRKPHVYLPEIQAYKDYLAENYPHVQIFETNNLKNKEHLYFDIIWHFMGNDNFAKGRYVVHEYNSLSTQPFAYLKNIIKRKTNAKPHQRVFLNRAVRRFFKFNDNIPNFCRDMGIDSSFFNVKLNEDPDYDFVYTGGFNRGLITKQFLDYFSQNMKNSTLLIVGDAPQKLQDHFKNNQNITFKGRVPYKEIPKLISNARFGLNIMPDVFPFNIQTATKVLEYAAIGLPIITTDYQWIRKFENRYEAKYFKLAPDMSNLSLDALNNYKFIKPNVSNLNWNEIIKKSNIFSFINSF